MTRILANGALGKMGRAIALIAKDCDAQIVAGVDVRLGSERADFPLYRHVGLVKEAFDVIVDFTKPDGITSLLAFASEKRVALVLATTGFSESELMQITSASRDIAIFRSANFSIGVHVLMELVRRATLSLPNCDIEITETHHRGKIDAPSGTALSLARVIDEAGTRNLIPRYGRAPNEPGRQDNEIGIHAIRGGSASGDHTVHFLLDDETIELTHRAHSRVVFARGALAAAKFVAGKPAGLFGMNDMFDGIWR